MYVEGCVLTTSGEPITGAVIDTWETDGTGEQHFEIACALLHSYPYPTTNRLPLPSLSGKYDLEYTETTAPECRGRLKADGDGKYGYRAIVPVPYWVPYDVGSPFPLTLFPRIRDGSI
jgi:protocatechuate 3,4-dioxygenase beta subunit